MPDGLKRYYDCGHMHSVTFSCYRQRPLLNTMRARSAFVEELGRVRDEMNFRLIGYVVMPEHVHLLMSGHPKDWAWSSWSHYRGGEAGLVRIDAEQ